MLFVAVCPGWMVGGPGPERLVEIRVVHFSRQTHLRRQLLIHTHACQFHVSDAVQRDVEGGVWCLPDGRQRLVLVFVVGEVVKLVLHNRAARGAADLLVRVGHDLVQHRIGRVPVAVPEVADEGTRKRVGARLGDGVHLHARRAALRGVEPVRDELELRDRVVAVPGLVAGAQVRGHLQAVDVDLELPDVHSVLHGQRALRVGPVPGRQQRERHPVAALGRQLRHLARVDAGSQTRGGRLDERRLRRHGERFGHATGGHLEVDGGRLSHEELHAVAGDRVEAGKLRRDLVDADAHRDTVGPALIGHGLERIARRGMHRLDRDAGQHGHRRIGDDARQCGFLRRPDHRHDQDHGDNEQPSHQTRSHGLPPRTKVRLPPATGSFTSGCLFSTQTSRATGQTSTRRPHRAWSCRPGCR